MILVRNACFMSQCVSVYTVIKDAVIANQIFFVRASFKNITSGSKGKLQVKPRIIKYQTENMETHPQIDQKEKKKTICLSF